MDANMKAEIERLLTGTGDARDEARLKQAVRDAQACMESRRARTPCDCFCCSLYTALRGRGYDLARLLNAPDERAPAPRRGLPDPTSDTARCPICHQSDKVEWSGGPFFNGRTQAMCKRCGLGFHGVRP